MKVAVEHSALMALMVACGEAQGVLLRGTQLNHGDSSFNSFSTASASARASVQKAIEALNTSPIALVQQADFHSGPG